MRATLSLTDAKRSIVKQLNERYKKLTAAASVDVGFFPKHIHPEAHVPVAQVAAWNEYGTNGAHPVPPRPFFRYSVESYSVEWANIIPVALKATGYDSRAALEAVGQLATMRIQSVIKAWADPPNAKATERTKGFNDPLTETQYMVRHVTYKVNKK